MKVRIAGRLAFPALFQAKNVNGEGEPAFSAGLIFPEADPTVVIIKDDGSRPTAKLSACMKEVAKAKWGEKADAIYKAAEKGDKLCVRDGDLKADYEGYPGNHFISARNKTRPTVVDKDGSPLTEADGKPYGGCFVHMSIELWAQDNKFGKRINAQLRGVQFHKDGDAFSGGGSASENEFENLDDGSDAGDLA